MSRSPTHTRPGVTQCLPFFLENSGYRKRGKPARKRLSCDPTLWPLRSACTDFVEATSINWHEDDHHILAKILEQLWPEIGRLLSRPRVPGHVGITTEAELGCTDYAAPTESARLLNAADTVVGAGASALDGDIWLKCCFTSTKTVGLLGTQAQDVHLDFHTGSEI